MHGLPSSQLRAAPRQTPSEHVSPVVQAFPSSQGVVFGVLTQPVAGSQESSVHGLPSSQLRAAPTQTPSEHVSPVVQAFPSSHTVPAAASGLEHAPVAGSQRSSVHGF